MGQLPAERSAGACFTLLANQFANGDQTWDCTFTHNAQGLPSPLQAAPPARAPLPGEGAPPPGEAAGAPPHGTVGTTYT